MTDRLSDAVRALKRSTESPADDAPRTRARIMMSLHQQRFSRSRRTAWLIPAGIIVAASTAWAGSNGRIAGLVRAATERFSGAALEEPASPPAPARLERRVASRSRAMPAAQPVVPERTENPATSPVAAPPAEPPARAEPSKKARIRPSPAEPVLEAFPSADEPGFEAYRAAHRAHFAQKNPAAALPAWEAYLRAAPSGRFASEARYNRALCLVRLGRYTEAEAALAPFARGDFGGYRQREASALLDELRADTRTVAPQRP